MLPYDQAFSTEPPHNPGLAVARSLYKASPFLSNQKLLSPNSSVHTNFQFLSPISSLPKQQAILNPMAACIDTSRTGSPQNKPLSRDPNRSKTDEDPYQFMRFCRGNFSDQVSCLPICQNRTKTTHTRRILDDLEQDEDKGDGLWLKMQDEARADINQEPMLSNFIYASILAHASLESALANHLSVKLSNSSLSLGTLVDIFMGVLTEDQEVIKAVKDDLRAVKERDPACVSYTHCFLNFKGFLACQSHRIAHKLWSQGRTVLALLIQNRVSEVFAVDIHPGAKIGHGILLDHATGVVVGETAVIGNNVSILHNVTLGGTGKASGDRHPKIGDGVLIGAGTCILGNIKIGEGAKIGACSVVLKEVPPRTTAVGNPARLLGGKENPIKHDKIPSYTMDHTYNMSEWSDYVI
ncbi:serine acetyltransferase 1, chloroplastic [Prunus dulcis]|uniref:serine acetyltransferase 1, chloroplastic n=1 Tax=Prunus dulcis TaxID=3755 RepID=UPI00148346DF|nr:serine acetyltransferase 1, chloroplastic [Prunus dulcis]